MTNGHVVIGVPPATAWAARASEMATKAMLFVLMCDLFRAKCLLRGRKAFQKPERFRKKRSKTAVSSMRTAVKRLYEFGPFRLDTYRGVLLREGEIVDVTPKVVDLLQVLVENNGQIVPREELLSEVWPDAVVDEANINRTVSMLRRALEDAGIDCIETVPKRGYRFTGEVREIDPDTLTLERVTRARVT